MPSVPAGSRVPDEDFVRPPGIFPAATAYFAPSPTKTGSLLASQLADIVEGFEIVP